MEMVCFCFRALKSAPLKNQLLGFLQQTTIIFLFLCSVDRLFSPDVDWPRGEDITVCAKKKSVILWCLSWTNVHTVEPLFFCGNSQHRFKYIQELEEVPNHKFCSLAENPDVNVQQSIHVHLDNFAHQQVCLWITKEQNKKQIEMWSSQSPVLNLICFYLPLVWH